MATSSTTTDAAGGMPSGVLPTNGPPLALAPVSVVRSVDRELLLCLRSGEPKVIGDLTEMLGVTATAVRQRIERLLAIGLITREKVVAGRGRPTFRYSLTPAGYRRAGADPADLAESMWTEIVALPAGEVREQLISAIARRLGRQMAAAMQDVSSRDDVAVTDQGTPFGVRMRQLTAMLQSREIPASMIESNGDRSGMLPVLDIEACPYPNLTEVAGDRSMCRLEEQMLSEALGEEVHLSSCRLDGDSCCQFTAAASSQSVSSNSPISSNKSTGG